MSGGAPVFIDEFSRHAGEYSASRPSYPHALYAMLAALAPSKERAWDAGTGNGQAARGLAEHFSHVIATDASAEQIARAVVHPRIEYTVALAQHCPAPAGSIDLVTVAQAAHWFDRDAFYAEVRRVARPGAIVTLFGYSWFYVTPELDALAETFLLQPLEGHWLPNNPLLWNGYRTIEFPFTELPRIRLAIHRDWTLDELLEYYLTWSAVQRKRAAEGDMFLSVAQERLRDCWGEPARRRHVVLPLHTRIGRVA